MSRSQKTLCDNDRNDFQSISTYQESSRLSQNFVHYAQKESQDYSIDFWGVAQPILQKGFICSGFVINVP